MLPWLHGEVLRLPPIMPSLSALSFLSSASSFFPPPAETLFLHLDPAIKPVQQSRLGSSGFYREYQLKRGRTAEQISVWEAEKEKENALCKSNEAAAVAGSADGAGNSTSGPPPRRMLGGKGRSLKDLL